MADNVIKVSVTSTKSQRVSVSSSQQATNITASPDTGRFWSQTSKNWAVSDNIVDGEDYSSKYYANKSKESANTAKSYLETTQETYSNFVASANGYISELTDLKDAGAVEIHEAVASGKDEINSAKTTIINDIELVADGEKKEIEDLIDNGKEELKESIGDVKVLTTLEIGDIGFTQMAIDESKGKRRILNGQVIIQDQFVEFTNKVKSSVALNSDLACTEAEWQTAVTMSTNGVCEKFVIDDNAGTIRLPKYPSYFISGLTGTAPVVGNGIALGLSNGEVGLGLGQPHGGSTSRLYLSAITDYYGLGVATAGPDVNHPTHGVMGLTSDPTKSGVIAQLSNNQTEQIKGTYFIQVATGAETEDNIINEIELNNPFSLLDYKYSEYELNNLSWLRSNGQYNSKAIYPAVYELLLKIYNGTETKAGVSVKLHTDTSATEYDFRINTAEETFMLPTKVKLASGKAVVGNGMTLGFTDGVSGQFILRSTSNSVIWSSKEGYGQYLPVDTPAAASTNYALGVTTEAVASGIETSDSDLYLYFYVGETVQNANLINAGRIEEQLGSIVPNNSSLISSYAMPSGSKYVDLTLGNSLSTYTAPANGYFYISANTSATSSAWIYLGCNMMGSQSCGDGKSGLTIHTFIPVKIGDVAICAYDNINVNTATLRFIYAQGEI